MDEPSRQPANSKVPPDDEPMRYGDIMSRQRIKQIATIAILLGVIFVGIGGVLSPPVFRTRHEWAPKIVSLWAYHFENAGNFFMIIAPVVLIIVDWRNIFPAVKIHKDK